MIAILFK